MAILERPLNNEWQQLDRNRRNGIRFYGLADAREAILMTIPPAAPVIGCDMQGDAVSIDLDTQSPHIGISMGTGGGKSVVMKSLMSQTVGRGAKGVILDYKMHSHRWAYEVPGITYVTEVADIHETLCGLAEEVMNLNRQGKRVSNEEFALGEWMGPRVVIGIEEINSMVPELREYWTGKGRSPAIAGLHKILAMGRAVHRNAFVIGQRLSTGALGGSGSNGSGGDARANIAAVLMARYDRDGWRMLGSGQFVPPSEHPGRMQLCMSKTEEVQGLYLTDREAVDVATGKEI